MRTLFVFVLTGWLFPVNVSAQSCQTERYLSNVFQSAVSQDVIYGNSPALTAVYVAESVTVDQDMTMDVFLPVGDTLPKRPAVILAYGGGYLFGTKEDEDVWSTCDSLAKKGYVTASINYRMNMNVASPSSAVRAIYRATQDYSAAIRFLKEHSDGYDIDTNYIFVGGVSAGGFSAMHAVFLDENERPAVTYQSGLGGINPDLGCVSCAGNNHQHSNNVRGIINLWGALMDTAYIQQEELVPMTLFHGTDDLIVPYEFGFPFTALFLMPEVFGSASITQRVLNLGGSAELNTFPGVGHNIWGLNINNVMVDGPTEHWNPITDSIVSFLYENIRPDAPLVIPTSPICEGDTIVLQIQNFPPDGRACWNIESGNVTSAASDSSEIRVVWSNAGTYQIIVTVVNHLEAVSVPSFQQVNVSEVPAVSIVNNGGVLETSGQFPFYQWYLDSIPLPGENQSTLNVTQNGHYIVEAINSDGCNGFSDPYLLVGISENVSFSEDIAFVQVYDVLGRLVDQAEYQNWKGISPQQQVTVVRYYSQDGGIVRTEVIAASAAF